MEDKIQSLCSFRQRFEESVQIFKSTAVDAYNKFIFICVNINKMSEYLHSVISPFCVVVKPLFNDIIEKGSLGSYLRTAKNDDISSESVLFLDFFNELHDLYSTNAELVDCLNTNRDLFMSAFRCVVIILSNDQTYAVMKHAFDLWSCKSLYVDTTRWLSNLRGYPLVEIRVFSHSEDNLVDELLKNPLLLQQYSVISAKIQKINEYEEQELTELNNEIIKISNGICHYTLNALFFEKLLSLTFSKKKAKRLPHFIKKLNIIGDINLLLDVYIMLGEFYFKYGDYSLAAQYYNHAQQILISFLPGKEPYALSLLACNELICRESYNRTLTSEGLELKLKEILKDIEEPDSACEAFIDTYLQLIRCSSDTDSYAKHRDNYVQLNKIVITHIPKADITDAYYDRLCWEKYLARDNEPPRKNSSKSVLILYQTMLDQFCIGEYPRALSCYDKLKKYLVSVNDYNSLNTLKAVKQNMCYLISILTKCDPACKGNSKHK